MFNGKTMKYKFIIEQPENPDYYVPNPQVVIFHNDNKLMVVVYLMENCANEITDGIVKQRFGKIELGYKVKSPSGMYTACFDLRKIVYEFHDAQGMTRNFEFIGKKDGN